MKRPRSPRYTERFNYVDDDADRASSPPSSSSSPPVNKQDGFLYDVFLSFRGPDTRNGFTSHLYHELKDNKGIRTFMDSEELEKGQEVDKLFGYIERSKILLPIFSKGYADSKWCLREIAKIVECKRLVIPVFFDVEPRDVGHQTGPFTEAFRDYVEKDDVNKEEVSKWRDAMTTLGKVSGYTLADTRGNEAKLIQLIVKRVLMEVNKTSIYVADYPVGLDARITDVMEKLDIEAAGDAKMVGIYGMGGLGKTTLAKAVYNKISNRFDASCFIPNIRDAAKRYDDLLSRQKQLIRDLFSNEKEVNSIDEGIGIINIWMQRKKVLLVLDDVDDKLVDNKSQIQAMVGDRLFCSGSGSRIIVTTRNKQVFNTQEGVNVYELEGLNDVQSLELFSWHAFRQRQPTEEFAQLSRDAASTAARLPLALKIFGSHFYDLKTVKEWEDALKILKDDQHKDIYQRLKISFDALLEREKQVFLDIACFFIGDSWKISVEHATLMWEDCKFYPNTTIKVLMHKSLVSINDETGEFEMHDHIRDMGRKIVQDEGLYKGSRLWEVEKTLDVLQNKQEMENVEAIQLYPEFHEEITLEAMPRLRMLELGWNVTLEGHCKHFLKKLKWLEWEIEGLDSLPDGLQFGNLVVLDLSKSSITQVWNPQTYGRKKVLQKLKVLNMSECYDLTSCPDFSSISMPNLQKLDFSYCESLSELHPSIGLLKSLTRLYLRGCYSLRQLPQEIYQLTSLEELDLCGCSKITTLPSLLGDSSLMKQHLLGNLKVLNMSECYDLTSCPDFSSMPNLQQLDFNDCRRLSEVHPSIELLKSLTHMYLRGCESLEQLPQEIYQLTSLEVLYLQCCSKITSLPSLLGDSSLMKQHLLCNLKVLNMRACYNLTSCPDFSSMLNLQKLDFSYCQMLGELHPSIGLLKTLTDLYLRGCVSLEQLPQEIYQLTSLEELDLSRCYEITSLPSLLGDSSLMKQHLLGNLKVLNMSGCFNLTSCPDFSSMPNLQKLDFSVCQMLSELHPSIELLKSLTHLDLSGCESLEQLPQEIYQLTSLEELDLQRCSKITSLPSLLEDSSLMKQHLPGILKVLNIRGLITKATAPYMHHIWFNE